MSRVSDGAANQVARLLDREHRARVGPDPANWRSHLRRHQVDVDTRIEGCLNGGLAG